LLSAFAVDLVFMAFLRNERANGAVRIPQAQSFIEALGYRGILRRASNQFPTVFEERFAQTLPRTANPVAICLYGRRNFYYIRLN